MADRDDPFYRSGDEDRPPHVIGPYADDPALTPYYRSDGEQRRNQDRYEPVDPDYQGYTEYGRDHDDWDRIEFPATEELPPPPHHDWQDPGDYSDEGDEHGETPPPRQRKRWRILIWILKLGIFFFVMLLAWLAIFAPVSRTAEPLVPPPIVLQASDGTPIARMGPVMGPPVVLDELPPYVRQAFLAIEDRRFDDHWGIDPRGIARALWSNATSGTRHGGSTITQQLVKLTYLNSDQTIFRKVQEVPIALWLEAWLSKDQILERYLSNVYFGDNVYGLRAASLHYFYRHPENLTLSQATMLAGLVRAPSRYAPTHNLEGAQSRQRVVIAAMVDAGYLDALEAEAIPLAEVDHRPPPEMPSGGYFADWAIEEARAAHPPGYETIEVRTTLESDLQRLAERVTRSGTPGSAQVALVAMRPNGEVVAMVGGRDYSQSAFNRATQALRQPGSTFKLIVYLAALRSGLTPDSIVDDSPIETGEYRPSNAGGTYRGEITLREAFARSSNVVAVRLYQRVGSEAIADAAESLGLTRDLPGNASVALGSAGMPLIELVSAYATVANDGYAVEPHALPREEGGFLDWAFGPGSNLSRRERDYLLDMLGTTISNGTGSAARLSIPAFGKTGTSQDSRDAVFVGFAGDLIVGVWIGNDDNSPLGNASGGGAPARIWRNFMAGAISGAAPRPERRAAPRRQERDADDTPQKPPVTVNPDGSIDIDTGTAGGRIVIGEDGIDVQPDAQTRRRLDELERIGEEIERATGETERDGR